MVAEYFRSLEQTRKIFSHIETTLQSHKMLSDTRWQDVEKEFLIADIGPQASQWLIERLRGLVEEGHIASGSQLAVALRQELIRSLGQLPTLHYTEQSSATVIVMAGDNDAGTTITAVKLASYLHREGRRVLLISKDIFQADEKATIKTQVERFSDLAVWSDADNLLNMISHILQSPLIQEFDIIIIDTSGYPAINNNRPEYLKNISDAIRKVLPQAPHEVLIVFDVMHGVKNVSQLRDFAAHAGLTGIVLSKVEMSSRAGCAFALVDDLGVPIKFLGTGEALEDLLLFNPTDFVAALFESGPKYESGPK
jgi:fused signal recognition particle receptor